MQAAQANGTGFRSVRVERVDRREVPLELRRHPGRRGSLTQFRDAQPHPAGSAAVESSGRYGHWRAELGAGWYTKLLHDRDGNFGQDSQNAFSERVLRLRQKMGDASIGEE